MSKHSMRQRLKFTNQACKTVDIGHMADMPKIRASVEDKIGNERATFR